MEYNKSKIRKVYKIALDKRGGQFEEFIKARMKEELGLIENPSELQLEEIISRKVNRKPKGNTIFFGDFIDKISYEGANLLDSGIIEEPIRFNLDNEF